MLNQVLALVLPVLGWWLLTGIINLAFAYKSQIEAWAESNPRLASMLKLSRAIGFDPWNFLSSLKLFAQKKLPDAQKADSPIGKFEQRKADLKRLGVQNDDDPPTGEQPVGRMFPDEPEKIPPSLPGVRLSSFIAIGWMLTGCGAFASQAKDPCSEVSWATVSAGCEARIERECRGDATCPVYVECTKARKTWQACK